MVNRLDLYRCVWCGMHLQQVDSITLLCRSCSKSYPIVSDVPILTLRPRALLTAATRALQAVRTTLRDLDAELVNTCAMDPGRKAFQGRAERALAGTRANLVLVEKYWTPAADFVREYKLDFIDTLHNCAAGWSPDAMLPYFYQDWAPTEDFSRAKNFMVSAVSRHRPDAQAIAVLGAGACGLAHAIASSFEHVYGIDLSAPTLLIARAVLRGEAVVIHLENASWHPVHLQNLEPPRSNVHLAVADVARLPLPPDSMSAVVTQYLMDVVGNPYAIAREIHRVLKPGGVWLNFSRPMWLPSEPRELGRPSNEELPHFLGQNGLELVDSGRERFVVLNLAAVSVEATVAEHDVQVFTARKVSGAKYVPDPSGQFEWGDDEGWWQSVPELMRRGRGRINSIIAYKPGGAARYIEVTLGEGRVRMDQKDADLLQRLLDLVDGKRILGEIYNTLLAGGCTVNRTEFRELFHYLSERHGIVDLRSNSVTADAGRPVVA